MSAGASSDVIPAIPVRFGLFLSQANRTWAQTLEEFQLAEDLGFDHAWLVDHLVDTDGPPEVPIHEAWTLLAAIAARTTRIRLGVLVTSNTFRHPAILAKEAVTVDHVSGGSSASEPAGTSRSTVVTGSTCPRPPSGWAAWRRPSRCSGSS